MTNDSIFNGRRSLGFIMNCIEQANKAASEASNGTLIETNTNRNTNRCITSAEEVRDFNFIVKGIFIFTVAITCLCVALCAVGGVLGVLVRNENQDSFRVLEEDVESIIEFSYGQELVVRKTAREFE